MKTRILQEEFLKYTSTIEENVTKGQYVEQHDGLLELYVEIITGYESIMNNLKRKVTFCSDRAIVYFYNLNGNILNWKIINNKLLDDGRIYMFRNCLHKAIKAAAEELQETIIYTVGIFPNDDCDYSVHKAYRINGVTGEYESVSLEWLNSKLPPHERMMEGNFELPDEPQKFRRLNKLQVVRELTKLDGIIPMDSYVITYGAAMCIHGIKEYTRYIDLNISKEAFDTLVSKGCKVENYLNNNYIPYIKFNNVIDLFIEGNSLMKTNIQYEIDKIGFRIQTVQSLLNEKQARGREKDLKDVELIKAFLNKKSK